MTLFEKISLLGLAAVAVVASASDSNVIILCVWVLAMAYGFGAYWLFRRRPGPVAWVRVAAGIGFAVALIDSVNSFRLRRGSFEQLGPVLPGLVCLGLGAYLLAHRRAPDRVAAYRPLFVRAAAVFGVVAVFAYCPVTLAAYRAVLFALNQDQPYLLDNLRMFDYAQRTDQALAEKDGPAAVAYARRSYAAGNRWLGHDSLAERRRVSMTYTNLYKAYRCLGDAAYSQAKYAEALRSYRLGHAFLARSDDRLDDGPPALFWEEEKAWSLENLGLCCLKLHRPAQSDSLFGRALGAYNRAHPAPDVYTARFIADLARSQAAGRHWGPSARLYQRANRLLATQAGPDAAAARLANSLNLVLAYLALDSLRPAQRTLGALALPAGDSASRGLLRLYTGTCYFKQGRYAPADQMWRTALRYYQALGDTYWAPVYGCELLLAKNNLVRGAYPLARQQAETAQSLVVRKMGTKATQYAQCEGVLAGVDQALGKYDAAARQYAEVLATYQHDAEQSETMEAHAELAELALVRGNLPAAQEHVAGALAQLARGETLSRPGQTGLLNVAADVSYAAGRWATAGAQYRQTLAINARFDQLRSPTTAAAWNGLGLLATEQRHWARADSLFAGALALQDALFGAQHPATATVCLNFALLRIRQGRLAEASALIERAQQIADAALPPDHDLFGNLSEARGDVARRQQNAGAARDYYKNALLIYVRKFGPAHWRAQQAHRKLSA